MIIATLKVISATAKVILATNKMVSATGEVLAWLCRLIQNRVYEMIFG